MSEIRDIHQPFAEWLNRQGVPFINARSDRESTIAEGHPDFTLVMNNRCLHLELKTEKGKLSPAQVKRIDYLKSKGNTVLVVRDFNAAVAVVTEWMRKLEDGPHREMLPLYRMGNGVWEKMPDGTYQHRRPIQPGDHNLPTA